MHPRIKKRRDEVNEMKVSYVLAAMDLQQLCKLRTQLTHGTFKSDVVDIDKTWLSTIDAIIQIIVEEQVEQC